MYLILFAGFRALQHSYTYKLQHMTTLCTIVHREVKISACFCKVQYEHIKLRGDVLCTCISFIYIH